MQTELETNKCETNREMQTDRQTNKHTVDRRTERCKQTDKRQAEAGRQADRDKDASGVLSL